MLTYTTYIAPSKPVVSSDLPPGETRRMWSPTSATLITGDRDAVLVDALMTRSEGQDLAGWIAAKGKELTTIFITHGHGDHFFGVPEILARFPSAEVVATPAVVEAMRGQLTARWLDDYWLPRFPGQLTDHPVVAEPLEGTLVLEGEELTTLDLGHTDTDSTTGLYVESIGLVVAGDSVYDNIHPYLAESGNDGLEHWLAALDTLEALNPKAVVAGHKPFDGDDSPRWISETRRYLQDFAAIVERTHTTEELYAAVVEAYPDRGNRGVLWNSARALKPLA
ncbi:MBL fold metallo-hydrolase [Kribbella sp. ALI-6-A]|uniref:MBL fold metallo-hydrolase n=1 Tax=Kribbella sp. ALI-6-A TaxID=1933817 RepID=UPI00097C4B6C|nr:MBL fold metallo-hydrolase [Kribbella sp. ALI-6-A]ONI69321.1 MBL fold metallo-hydrolase [Kribbella sp. ALI-6-A]